MNADRHIIDKVFLDINAINETEAYWLKDHISSFLNDQVFPDLEQLFNEMDVDDSISRFERIDLDISLDNWDNPDALRKEIENQLRQKMSIAAIEKRYPVYGDNNRSKGISEYHQVKKISGGQNLQSIFFIFLKNGNLPWYGHKSDIDKLISEKEWINSLETERFVTGIKKLLNADETALERFVLQLPVRNVLQFIDLLGEFDLSDNRERNTFVERLNYPLRNQFISVLLKIGLQQPEMIWKPDLLHFYAAYLTENYPEKSIDEQIHQLKNISLHTSLVLSQQDCEEVSVLLKQSTRNQLTEKGVTKQKERKIENDPTIISRNNNFTEEKEPLFFEQEAGDIIVQNAGQVLFHPFLKLFFQQFNWLDEEGNIKFEDRFKAIQALHYCATGNEQFFEGDLVLEKFLCDVPLQKTVPATSLLNESIKKEADNLLRELIKNWPVLKNTSPDGLREMFVKRSGKLIQKDRNFKLIVERKTQDILLEKLQWNISIIKLPWKKELIFVEW
ncbi:contractile injection system tape measure protein [uncultured Draconibacterium sp.]|uniref:contractile injection system tape measure protein n=1 Tax=uncultured Draconibacterium sp. TaxID=1573823 RepID=UPI0029C72105|nr:contractile injection system tape measure protein [uncultured Draconibacterium sp.]